MGLSTAQMIALAVAGTSVAVQYDQGVKQRKAQGDAMRQAKQQADAQAKEADRAFNRQNQKSPDIAAMLSANRLAAKSGGSSTLLTGPTGVDPNQLMLGKNTLLGS